MSSVKKGYSSADILDSSHLTDCSVRDYRSCYVRGPIATIINESISMVEM